MENSSTRHCHSMSAPTCQRRWTVSCLQAIQETSPATLPSPDIAVVDEDYSFGRDACLPKLPKLATPTHEGDFDDRSKDCLSLVSISPEKYGNEPRSDVDY